jgi:hypothetical protein
MKADMVANSGLQIDLNTPRDVLGRAIGIDGRKIHPRLKNKDELGFPIFSEILTRAICKGSLPTYI